jgi:hypothetical protein
LSVGCGSWVGRGSSSSRRGSIVGLHRLVVISSVSHQSSLSRRHRSSVFIASSSVGRRSSVVGRRSSSAFVSHRREDHPHSQRHPSKPSGRVSVVRTGVRTCAAHGS